MNGFVKQPFHSSKGAIDAILSDSMKLTVALADDANLDAKVWALVI